MANLIPKGVQIIDKYNVDKLSVLCDQFGGVV